MRLRFFLPITTLALFLIGAIAFAAPAIQVTLSIDPSKTLPGLSVPLALHIKNSGPPILVASNVGVRLTAPGGDAFIAGWGEGRNFGHIDLGTEEDDPLSIGTNEAVDLVVPAVDLGQPSWALDHRLLEKPGSWSVEVLLYDGRDERGKVLASSSAATLTIAAPDNRDMPTWDAIKRKEARMVAEKVYLERSDSPYFPYLASLVAREAPLDRVAILQHAVELHPSTPTLPWLRFTTAYYYRYASQKAFDVEQNIEKAVALSEKAREELVLLSDSPDAWSKLKAREQLEDLPDRAYYTALQRLAKEKGIRKKP